MVEVGGAEFFGAVVVGELGRPLADADGVEPSAVVPP